MTREPTRRLWLLLGAAAVVVAAVSVAAVPSLGYDAWGWMTWGREIGHLELNTLSGPSWKPLPALVATPIALISADHTPEAWLFLVRLSALASLGVAFEAARLLARGTGNTPNADAGSLAPAASSIAPAGSPRLALFAGLVAVIILGTSTDLVKTAMYGSSEPVLTLCALGAVLLHVRGRPLLAIGALALAGLMRPEAWVITGFYALWLLWTTRRADSAAAPAAPSSGNTWSGPPLSAARPQSGPALTRVVAVLATVTPPLIWFGLDWLGSGRASQSASTAQHLTAGSAARADFPAFEVLTRATDTLILPALILIVIATALAIRRRATTVLWLIAASALWIALVAIQAQLGFTGDRRYLATAAAVLSVVAGVGTAWVVALLPGPQRTQKLATYCVLAALLASSLVPLRTSARQVSVAREGVEQLEELQAAISQAGGPERVLALGTPVVNPWMQTSLAWSLDAPIESVIAAWSSKKTNPRWAPPAVLFIAPRHFAGTRPAVPGGTKPERLARSGRWQVLVVR